MPIPVTKVNVAPGSTGSFVDCNISAYIPANAGTIVGVILEIVNTNTTTVRACSIRKNGSTDAAFSPQGNLVAKYHTFAAVGVDGSGIFEANIANATDVKIYLRYLLTSDEAGFLTNGVTTTLSNITVFTDIDISASTGADTALYAFFIVSGSNAAHLRKNGSTDAPSHRTVNTWCGFFVAVDGSEICEYRSLAATQTARLLGWMKGNVTAVTNLVSKVTATTGSYVDVDLSSQVPQHYHLAYERIHGTAADSYNVRRNGSADDEYWDATWNSAIAVTLDDARVAQQKIETVNVDLFHSAYSPLGIENDAKTATTRQNTSTYNLTHTCAGTNRFLVASVALITNVAVTGITYNGVAMTYITSSVQGAYRIEIWGLANPATGANTVAVTLAGATDSYLATASFKGVNQTFPFEQMKATGGTSSGQATVDFDVLQLPLYSWVFGAVCANDVIMNTLNGTYQDLGYGDASGAGGNELNCRISWRGPFTDTSGGGSLSFGWDCDSGSTFAIAGFVMRPFWFGTPTFTATAGLTKAPATVVVAATFFTGAATYTATAGITKAPATPAIVGTVVNPTSHGSLAYTRGPATMVGVGVTLTVCHATANYSRSPASLAATVVTLTTSHGTASITKTAATPTAAGRGVNPVYTGTAGISKGPATLVGAVTTLTVSHAALAYTRGPASLVGVVDTEPPVYTGTLAATAAPGSMVADAQALEPTFTGTLAHTHPPGTLAGVVDTGVPVYTAALAYSRPPAAAVGLGAVTVPAYTATVAYARPGATVAGVVDTEAPVYTSTASHTHPAPTVAAVGDTEVPVYTGNLAHTHPPATMAGAVVVLTACHASLDHTFQPAHPAGVIEVFAGAGHVYYLVLQHAFGGAVL